MEPSPTRRVKEAFVVADMLKGGPFSSQEALMASIENSRQEVTSWTDNQIDSFIAKDNASRLNDYTRARWELGRVDLDSCTVWRHMGDRPWAEGRVTTVAEFFRRHEPQHSRIWDMQKFSELFSAQLPIIVFPVGSSLRIDDGSHRAVAMVLAGLTSSSAWIGVL